MYSRALTGIQLPQFAIVPGGRPPEWIAAHMLVAATSVVSINTDRFGV